MGIDGAGPVQIVGLETGLPLLNVVPEPDKLVKVDRAVIVAVKHVHHQADSFDYDTKQEKRKG